jgi:hypothetical protein
MINVKEPAMRKSLLMLLAVLFVALPLCAQDVDQSTDKKDEEKDKRVEQAVSNILFADISDDLGYLYRDRTLFDFKGVSIELSHHLSAPVIKVRTPIKFLPTFGFGTTIPDPFIGSPAYDGIAIPRNSLNIDPVTGKYYWEW